MHNVETTSICHISMNVSYDIAIIKFECWNLFTCQIWNALKTLSNSWRCGIGDSWRMWVLLDILLTKHWIHDIDVELIASLLVYVTIYVRCLVFFFLFCLRVVGLRTAIQLHWMNEMKGTRLSTACKYYWLLVNWDVNNGKASPKQPNRKVKEQLNGNQAKDNKDLILIERRCYFG